jgi:NAD(P)-dependent dehydrogenase (short-subunit alcohol dehydrogenase family)
MNYKKLIIIAGITGSIGQEIARKYIGQNNTLVYGISRRGVDISSMDKIPEHHLIVKVDLTDSNSIKDFLKKISFTDVSSVEYFHLVGEFKTEINSNLEINVTNDFNNDGIDDEVYNLVAKSYIEMVEILSEQTNSLNKELKVVSFGSLADIYNIPVFQSFKKSRDIVKNFSKKIQETFQNVNIYLFNTSTIFAVDEMIERPFIFSTNVNPEFWITPKELADKMFTFMEFEKGVFETDIYIANPHFSDDYFNADITYKRRVQELFNKKI